MNIRLKDNMTRSLITAKKTTSAKEAYQLMQNNWIRHLPVVDDSGEYIIGMLSDRDLLRAPTPEKAIFEMMSAPVRSFDIDTPIRKIVQTMIDDKVSAFIVMKKDEVAGIVTSEDMLLLLAQILNEDSSPKTILSDFLTNPLLQKSMNSLSQAGI